MYKLKFIVSLLCLITVIVIYWEACMLEVELPELVNSASYQYVRRDRIHNLSELSQATVMQSSIQENGDEESECKIPVLDPFDKRTMTIINDTEPYILDHNCLDKSKMKFITDYNGNLLQAETFKDYWKTVNCCYFGFERGTTDEAVRYSERNNKTKEPICFPIRASLTKVKSSYEFIGVKCKNFTDGEIDYEDYFGIVRLKSKTELSANSVQIKSKGKFPNPNHDSLNVIILGLDSVSHMNFQRFMPKTRQFLLQNLSAVEFYGRNKVSESTFENVVPTLTGLFTEELNTKGNCWPTHDSYFDDCPFIWKQFKEKLGYLTFYAEDSTHRSAFMDSTLNGFENQPTDYDFRTLFRAMEIFERNDGCFNHQYSINILTDLMVKTAVALKDKNLYFQFLWLNTGNHDSAKSTSYDDTPIFEALNYMKSRDFLENSVFILMSDHGMTFGPYVQMEQGMLESRMPLLIMAFPEWFRAKYALAMKVMQSNIHRLTSPFDLHATLVDLLNTERLSSTHLNRRIAETNNRGISLFLPVPKHRTCENAGISDHWCICSKKILIRDPSSNLKIIRAVKFVVSKLNARIREIAQCAKLSLQSILSARKLIPESKKIQSKIQSVEKYDITFQVAPSNGIFQVTVNYRENLGFKLRGPISRINAFKNQGDCVLNHPKGNRELQQYCFCI